MKKTAKLLRQVALVLFITPWLNNCASDSGISGDASTTKPTPSAQNVGLPSVSPNDSAVALWQEWRELTQSTSNDPARYEAFLRLWPQAPDNIRITRNREEAAIKKYKNADLLAYFDKNPPKESIDAQIAYAQVLQEQRNNAKATQVIQKIYFAPKALTIAQEKRIYAFNILSQQDMMRRLSILLDADQKNAAKAMLMQSDLRLSPEARRMANLFLQSRDKSSETLHELKQLSPHQRNTPLALLAQIRAMRHGDGDIEAAHIVTRLPAAVARSMPKTTAREAIAATRNLWNAGDMPAAMQSAKQCIASLDDAIGYTDCALIKARAALWIKEGAEAEKYALQALRLSKNPINRARAYFDAGRAASMQNSSARALNYYTQAAQLYPFTFYGQLSITAAGLKGVGFNVPIPSPNDKQEFANMPFVKVASLAVSNNDEDNAMRFLLAAARETPSSGVMQLLTQSANVLDGANGSLRLGKAALLRGTNFIPALFPQAEWFRDENLIADGVDKSMVQAIARHESSFDPDAAGGANDTGLMQILPSTAEVVAAKAGIKLSGYRALFNPENNIRLGSAYIAQMLKQYGNSPVLATMAYNAGPGRVNQWLNTFGDPRSTVAPIDWIDRIPFDRTRDYAQRVIEARSVYRALIGDKIIRGLTNNDLRGIMP